MKTLNDATPTEWDVACREASKGVEMKTLKEPTQLVIGMTHKEMLALMADAGIFCSHDRFCRILQDVQQRAIASVLSADARLIAESNFGAEHAK